MPFALIFRQLLAFAVSIRVLSIGLSAEHCNFIYLFNFSIGDADQQSSFTPSLDGMTDGADSTTLATDGGFDKNSTALVEEGRYIKGDPLNGYYDFVITEGSYKFWVAFQVSN